MVEALISCMTLVGERTVKRGQGGETLYVSANYQLQNRQEVTKHIFVGTTRIVSKLAHFHNPNGLYDSGYERRNIYTYHPDHLGSSNFITDPEGKEFEHMEYTPYGESWIDEGTNLNVIGYRFTSKELDAETGLYYFGARYYDPLVSRWVSCDPALEKYLPERPVDDEARERNRNLPGIGGIYNPVNLNLYCYGANNPIKYTDPDGNFVIAIPLAYYAGATAVASITSWYLVNAPAINQAIVTYTEPVTRLVQAAIETGKEAAQGKGSSNNNSSSNNSNNNNDPNKIKNIFKSIKDSPNYPKGFKAVQNGTQKFNVTNKQLLEKLREIEPGKWSKVYKDGFDAAGNKVSIHYFVSEAGKVFDVAVKSGWSNL